MRVEKYIFFSHCCVYVFASVVTLDYEMDDEEQQQQQQPPAVQAPTIKIPPFWSSNPAAWFGMLDGQFVLRNITDDRLKFYHAMGAIPESVVKTVADLLIGAPPADAYQQLQARLLAAHTLTEFQRIEKLLVSQSSSNQKPSDVLADLIQYCPAGEQQTRIFRLLFLRHLPREMRMILAEDVASPLAALAARADQLWSHGQRQDSVVNAVADEQEDAAIAAVGGQHRPRGGNRRGGDRGGGRGGTSGRGSRGKTGAASSQATTTADPSPKALARESSGLCWNHWTWGSQAYSCKAPCTWQGN